MAKKETPGERLSRIALQEARKSKLWKFGYGVNLGFARATSDPRLVEVSRVMERIAKRFLSRKR